MNHYEARSVSGEYHLATGQLIEILARNPLRGIILQADGSKVEVPLICLRKV